METEELARDVEGQQAQIAALLIAVAALIRTHPDHTGFQLTMTAALEKALAPTGSFGQVLTPEQCAMTRDTVEWLGALRSAHPPAPAAPV